MNTPICDFVDRYVSAGAARLHVPGHKGAGWLGCEARDITEVAGADALCEAEGIIAESERNAASLFGSHATFYSAEGSSLCIRAMLRLAMRGRPSPKGSPAPGSRPFALAARNVHKAFVSAAALCDFDVEFLYPAAGAGSLCACPVTPEALGARLRQLREMPFCVYVTSPDYLGGMQDIAGLSRVCRAHGVPLVVDNAHGAYLKFLPESLHPIDLGADMCCDSAHKTLPVLTGGAYLHVSAQAGARFAEGARQALALFGSTSPSYLILQSLDRCNAILAGDFPARLAAAAARADALKARLADRGFRLVSDEPMKLTIAGDGQGIAARLRENGAECEYADRDHAVMMFSPDNRPEDFERVGRALDAGPAPGTGPALGTPSEAVPPPERAMSIREAVFADSEVLPVRSAVGRVCAAPAVSCPPAVPVAVSGEVITPEAVRTFEAHGIRAVRVVKE